MKATDAKKPATRATSQVPRVRTLIVDDQEPFLDALRRLIAAVPGFVVAGEATSGEEALTMADELSPQLVLMDVRMPGMGGVDAARSLAERHPEMMVVLISVHGQEELPAAILDGQEPARFVHKQNLRPRMLRELWQERQSK